MKERAVNVDAQIMIQGAEVFDRDGAYIGMAADPGGAYFLIEEGTQFVKVLSLPKRVIVWVDEDGVRLAIGKAEAEGIRREELRREGDPWAAEPIPTHWRRGRNLEPRR